jgi:TM2 domain-containing membrane protein YozV
MSLTCPYCRTEFEEQDEIIVCPECATQHHADCLDENGGCTVFGCSRAPVEEPKISVSDNDLAPVADQQSSQNAPSFFNLSGPTAPIQTAETIETSTVPAPPVSSVPAPTPPPPRIPGTTPPPPPGVIHSNHVPVMTYPTFGGYAAPAPVINSQTPRKSRVAFVLLAVFLGAFGGHNFYAGYVKRAVIQLCITLFSCFFGAVISWIWAIVEACMVNRDSDGIAFV